MTELYGVPMSLFFAGLDPNSPVLHPVFAKLAEHTNDPFWKKHLITCSRGWMGVGVAYKEGMLDCRLGRRLRLKLTEDMTSAEDCQRVLEYFQSTGIVSPEENERRIQLVEENQNEVSEEYLSRTSWNEFKHPEDKRNLLERWMDRVEKKMNLTKEEYNRLRSSVSSAQRCKYFTPRTVTVTRGCITEITGFQITDAERGDRDFIIPYNPNLPPPRRSPQQSASSSSGPKHLGDCARDFAKKEAAREQRLEKAQRLRQERENNRAVSEGSSHASAEQPTPVMPRCPPLPRRGRMLRYQGTTSNPQPPTDSAPANPAPAGTATQPAPANPADSASP